MRLINIIIISLLILNRGYSQTNHASLYESQSEVLTPFGPALKSNVHFVGKGNQVSKKTYSTQVIETCSGKVIQEFRNNFYAKFNISKGTYFENETSNSIIPDGWLTYGIGAVDSPTDTPISLYSVKWYVPSEPLLESDQLIYIFCGLQAIDSGVAHIVQPVLQWGKSPAGGGKYWGICNWYVSSDLNYFYDSLIKVSPGTLLEGKVQLISISDSKFNYYSSFTGYETGLQINNLPQFTNPNVVLETFNLKECREFPIDEKIRMFNIQIKSDTLKRNLKWEVVDHIGAQNDCSQYTKILSENSINGELDIHLHSPTDLDKFDLIHLYPNPCQEFLHISPKRLIKNCRVEIYNEFGRLEKTEYFKNMDYEANINMSNLAFGVYFVKFSYDYDKHTFVIIKR